MPSYKVKEKSEISSEIIKASLDMISYLNKKIEFMRSKCEHSFEITYNNVHSDEYDSYYSREYSNDIHCVKCGHTEINVKDFKQKK